MNKRILILKNSVKIYFIKLVKKKDKKQFFSSIKYSLTV